MRTTLLILLFTIVAYSAEPIAPLPFKENYNQEKAKLGMELFSDTILSKDYSTSCLSCHNIFEGGADSRVVSEGFASKKGNIQSPTVFNAKYNFRQFWNGRAKNLLEQADGPINNPAEHNMNAQEVEKRINNSQNYKEKFKKVYGVNTIPYALVLDAIVEFENALTTPNSKFDKFLRGEVVLSKDEKEGYIIFKKYACVTCHNGINIGGNSFQKMGTFQEYKNRSKFPDRSEVTNNKDSINVFKVPTLRNIAHTAPYFHDGSAKTFKDAIDKMSKNNLGIEFTDDQTKKIIKFLETLTGEKPKILDEYGK